MAGMVKSQTVDIHGITQSLKITSYQIIWHNQNAYFSRRSVKDKVVEPINIHDLVNNANSNREEEIAIGQDDSYEEQPEQQQLQQQPEPRARQRCVSSAGINL
jgi:hypothetical protein